MPPATTKYFFGLEVNCPTFLSDFKQIWSFVTAFHENPNMKFHENTFGENRVDTC